jgi:hypothetical protein
VKEVQASEGELAMQRSVPYVMHAIDGRVRVKVPAVRGSTAMAGAVTARLRAIDGVDGVHANPTTGSVVVYYTRGLTSSEAILRALRMTVHLSPVPESTDPSPRVVCPDGSSPRLATRMLHLAMDIAFQRLLRALVP